MELTSLVTGHARAGISLGQRALGVFAGRATQALGEVRRRVSGAERELDDVTLARKVETEIFRSRSVAKGKVDVNVAGGVVWLRGEAGTPDLIARLEAEAAAIPEVKRVENLLHLSATSPPAPFPHHAGNGA
jgi:osmotically-inducible protein OsmY